MYLSFVLFLIYKLCVWDFYITFLADLDSDLYLHANSGAVVIDRTAVLGVIQ